VVNKTEAVSKATENMKKDAIEDFKGITDYLSTWNSTYGTLIETMVNKTGELSGAFGDLEKKLRDADAAYKDLANDSSDVTSMKFTPSDDLISLAESITAIEEAGGTP
jgi:hypothetical protein